MLEPTSFLKLPMDRLQRVTDVVEQVAPPLPAVLALHSLVILGLETELCVNFCGRGVPGFTAAMASTSTVKYIGFVVIMVAGIIFVVVIR